MEWACWKLDQVHLSQNRCLELVLQMKKQAQNHHTCKVLVSTREHEDGHKEQVTSLVLPLKQNLYNCICERQCPLSWHYQL